jgi:hypothetical protein
VIARFVAQMLCGVLGLAVWSPTSHNNQIEPYRDIPASLRVALDDTIEIVGSMRIDSTAELRRAKHRLLAKQSAHVSRYDLSKEQAMSVLADEGLKLVRALRSRWPDLYAQLTDGGMVGVKLPKAVAEELIRRGDPTDD